jgi:hypothetical protein
MDILFTIFFLGLAVSLIVAKGLFMSHEFAAHSQRERKAHGQKQRRDTNETG